MQERQRCIECIKENNNEEFFNIVKGKNHQEIINFYDEERNTVLHIAALSGNLAVAKFAVENGVDVNGKNKQGKKALTLAMENGKNNVSSYLINISRTLILEKAKHEQASTKRRRYHH